MQEFNIYLLNQMQRLANLIDKDPSSPTYGCFDRAFWHYKYAKDFPDAMFQNNAFTLAIFYTTDFHGNTFYCKDSVLEFIKASINYTIKIQNNNGSWSEAYPNEYSYVATSFVLYNLTKALLLIKGKFARQELEKIERSLSKAKTWLISFKGPIHASNQLAAKTAAIINFNKVFGIIDKSGYSEEIDALCKMQDSTEGWFKEYGGFDLGYSSLTLHFLADIYNDFEDRGKKLENSIRALLGCLGRYMDFSYLGNIGSRKTAYFVPGGLRISETNLLDRMLSRVSEMRIPGPHSFDDKYFAEYFFGYAECISGTRTKTISTAFDDQRLNISRGEGNSAIRTIQTAGGDKIKVNLREAGRWVNADASMFFNGYMLDYRNAYFTLAPSDQYTVNTNGFQIRSCLTRIKHPLLLAGLGIILVRLYNYTLCRVSLINRLIDNILKHKLLVKGSCGGVAVIRSISLRKSQLIIKDRFSKEFPAGTMIRTGHDFSLKNISSAKFGVPLNSQFESIAQGCFDELEISFNLNNKEIRVLFTKREGN